MVLGQIQAAKRQVKRLMPDDPMWCEVFNLNGVLADLASAINRFSSAVPAYVCPYCKGKAENCKGCKGRGVISKFMWSMVPEELRKMSQIKGTLNERSATRTFPADHTMAVIRVYDADGNVIETHEHTGEFKEW